MEKILELLGIQNLDESKQTEIKEKLDTIVETKVLEGVKEKEEELKESLTEEYEDKFNKYKDQITEQFSNFVDEVLEEEMQIPEKVVEYARKGELYEDVIETLKTKMAIDEGHIDDDVKELLKESKEEIEKLKDQVNKIQSKNYELEEDAKEFAANIYLREKCEGLDLKKQEKVMGLLEGITNTEEIDKKFAVIVESFDDKNEDDLNEDENGKGEDNLNEDDQDVEPDDAFSKMKKY
jgi:hypothetical protein